MEELLSKEKYAETEEIVKKRLAYFRQIENLDTISCYIAYLGKAANMLYGAPKAQEEVSSFITDMKNTYPNAKQLARIYINAAYFISTSGDHRRAYRIMEDIDAHFLPNRPLITNELPDIFYAMGDFAARMGDNELADIKYRQSLNFLNKIPNPDKTSLVKAYYSIGAVFYFKSQYDSSLYYNNKAIALLEEQKDDIFIYNRLSAIQNHLGGIYTAMGNTKEAKRHYELAIANSKKFLSSTEPPASSKEPVLVTQLYAIGNLGTLYLNMNDLAKAFDIYTYYREQIESHLAGNDFELARALLFLGIICNERHRYAQAKDYSLKSINKMRSLAIAVRDGRQMPMRRQP
jgi:tetratricopeptide (TPR) repeat protein